MNSPLPLWLLVPFPLLLLFIAVAPLTPHHIKVYWDKYYAWLACGLAAVVAGYYLLAVPGGGASVLGMTEDYFSFICLIGSLFVIAGGIHINVKGEATPMANVVFLAIAAIAANFIGTTGASMVMIRPWIRMNKIRMSAYHVVFFIFLVSNVGGALTPIGDPPLFIGFLRGVPFFWLVERVIPQWGVTVAAILVVFYIFDLRSFRRMPSKIQGEVTSHPERWRFEGGVNVLLLFIVILSVFIPKIFILRELVMLGAATASYFLTSKQVHEENHFSFGPVKEVAFLFVGIFGTMMPVLEFLSEHAASLGFTHPLQYYFCSGALSSVLDNAPTYLNFLQLAQATAMTETPALYQAAQGNVFATTHVLLGQQPLLVVAVSMGSVFFGAMTYIGNGPNFMVKSIAHDAGVHCPSFFGYILKYSLPFLLPILVLSGIIFL